MVRVANAICKAATATPASKEQLIAQIAGAINGLATKLAVGINEVPASLGRSIKAVSEQEQGSAQNDTAA